MALSIASSSSAVCSLNAGTVSFNGVGTCLILANQVGNSLYLPAGQVSQSVSVGGVTAVFSTQSSADTTLGQNVQDTATLAGGVNPTGTITFNLYGPTDTTCSQAPVAHSTKAVSGNGIYQSAVFAPLAPGTYRWVASYGGDANNLSVTGVCGGLNESVTISACRRCRWSRLALAV